MSWVPILAVVLGALGLYALSQGQPRCPNCQGFVARNSRKCRKCGAPLSWD